MTEILLHTWLATSPKVQWTWENKNKQKQWYYLKYKSKKKNRFSGTRLCSQHCTSLPKQATCLQDFHKSFINGDYANIMDEISLQKHARILRIVYRLYIRMCILYADHADTLDNLSYRVMSKTECLILFENWWSRQMRSHSTAVRPINVSVLLSWISDELKLFRWKYKMRTSIQIFSLPSMPDFYVYGCNPLWEAIIHTMYLCANTQHAPLSLMMFE